MSDEQVKGIPEDLKLEYDSLKLLSKFKFAQRRIELIERIARSEQALAALEARFKEHTSAVGRFLLEMYQTMVDPLEDSSLKVAEMCELLLHQAREDREKLNRSPANFPADWNQDSSLETWFPLTAEEFSQAKIALAASQQQVAALEARNKELSAPVSDEELDEAALGMAIAGMLGAETQFNREHTRVMFNEIIAARAAIAEAESQKENGNG